MVWVLDVAVKHMALVIEHKTELEFFLLCHVWSIKYHKYLLGQLHLVDPPSY